METLILIAGGLFIIDKLTGGVLSAVFLAEAHNFIVRLFLGN